MIEEIIMKKKKKKNHRLNFTVLIRSKCLQQNICRGNTPMQVSKHKCTAVMTNKLIPQLNLNKPSKLQVTWIRECTSLWNALSRRK